MINEYVMDSRFQGFQWLNNETVLFNFFTEDTPMFLYSPVSKEQRILYAYQGEGAAFLYGRDEPLRDWGHNMYHKNVHNAQLTRFLYPTLRAQNNMVIIQDAETGIDLVEIPTQYGYGVWPSWSPDGKMLAIAINTNELIQENRYNRFEIFLYDQNGKQINQTDLLSLSRSVEILTLLWAPSNQWIAFTYHSNNDGNYSDTKYGIWDITTSKINNFCLPDDAYFSAWSPDNKFLLLGTRNETLVGTAYVLDPVTGNYLLNADGIVPIGWLN